MTTDIKIVGGGGEYMESVTVVEWVAKAGEHVTAGDVVVVVETAKAATEVEAPDSGVLAEILAKVGDEVEIGAVLGRIGSYANGGSPTHTTRPAETSAPPRTAAPDPSSLAPVTANVAKRVFATPLARRIAATLDIDLFSLTGTGPHGRIKRIDVERAHAEASPFPQSVAPACSNSAPSDTANIEHSDRSELRPHDGMRKTIAARLVRAKQTIPHFYLKCHCEIDSLSRLRRQINAEAPLGGDETPLYKISINDFIIKAHAHALASVPDANVSWSDEGLLVHGQVDVAVAVAITGGLITPIVRGADKKPLSEISVEMRDLARRAKERLLIPTEYQGGSSAISNLGMHGVEEFAAIINPPHASILAVGASGEVAVLRDGEVSNVTRLALTLSVDHRAVDGALGAELLQAIKRNLENPLAMLV